MPGSMWRFFRTALFGAALALIGIALPGVGHQPATAQSTLSEREREIVQGLATYIRADNEEVGFRLRELGFAPAMDEKNWQALPSVRKLEVAYEAAKLGSGGLVGANNLLSRLAHGVAAGSEAARGDRALAPLLAQPAPTGRIDFKQVLLSPADIKLGASDRAKIFAIINHADGGFLGGASGILQFEMGLPANVAYDILRRSATNAEALAAGLIRAGVPPPAATRLAELAIQLAKVSEAARADARLKSMVADALPNADRQLREAAKSLFGDIPQLSAKDLHAPERRLEDKLVSELYRVDPEKGAGWLPPGVPGLPSGTGGGGGSPAEKGAREFRAFRDKSHRPGDPGSFGRVIRSRGGFGGVIFGADVISAPNTPKPAFLYWVPLPSAPPAMKSDGAIAVCRPNEQCAVWGRLLVRFENGAEAFSQMVHRDDVAAARCLVFGGCTHIDTVVPGEAIPLVGLDNAADHVVFDGTRIQRGEWFRLIVNPAVDGRELGRAAVVVDAMATAFMRQGVRSSVEHLGNDVIQRVNDWFARTGETWKVVDVPTEISINQRRIVVRRRSDDTAPPLSVEERGALLDFVNFTSARAAGNSEGYAGIDAGFRAIVPILSRSIKEFERIHQFAELLAIVRWSKANGVSSFKSPAPDSAATRFASVALVGGRAAISSDSSEIDHSERMRVTYERIADAQIGKLPAAAAQLHREILPLARRIRVSLIAARLSAVSGTLSLSVKERIEMRLEIDNKLLALRKLLGDSPTPEASLAIVAYEDAITAIRAR